jgi:hypothetical protein
MAVLEDRFGATDPFEFWMYERDDMGALLTAVGEMGDVVEPRTVLENLTRPSREAFALALRMWCWYRDVADRCRVLGRWPASFEELTALLAEPDPDDPMQPAEIRPFLEQLARLASKRRYEPDAPA